MKIINLLAAIILFVSINASAQSKAAEFTGKFGMASGAIHIGGDYIKPQGDYGFGGYLFMQTPRELSAVTTVSKVTAFGALIKLNVVEKNTIKAYVAPGFGVAIIEGGSINGAGRKSDENIISPNFRIGVQLINNQNFSIGLERLQFANWLNDNVNNYSAPAEYYSVAASWLL